VQISGGYYRDILVLQQLLPVMRDVSGDFLLFQQGSAPAHRACNAVQFFESRPIFIPPVLWTPTSTDLNPVDYKIWGDIQQHVHQSQLYSIDEVLEVWHSVDRSVINDAADGWSKRRRSVYTGRGGHYEQPL